MRHKSVEVTLIENSTAHNPPLTFSRQTCDIDFGKTLYVASVDSPSSPARQPTTIVWHDGKAEAFGWNAALNMVTITNVKIVASDGTVLIDAWPLCPNRGVPHNVATGVEFYVLEPD